MVYFCVFISVYIKRDDILFSAYTGAHYFIPSTFFAKLRPADINFLHQNTIMNTYQDTSLRIQDSPLPFAKSQVDHGYSNDQVDTRSTPIDKSQTINLRLTADDLHPAPENFSMVVSGVYRSSFPRPENFAFLERLNLKSIL